MTVYPTQQVDGFIGKYLTLWINPYILIKEAVGNYEKGESILNHYLYMPSTELKICVFEQMTEEWLQFVVDGRRGVEHSYDVVEGPMADDQIWDYVEDYTEGKKSLKGALKRC